MDRLVKILVISDEDYVMKRIEDFFKDSSTSIDFVSDSKQAREKIVSSDYDIIITDSLIYGLTSLEVNRIARDKNRDVCVIVLADLSTAEIAHKTVDEGAFAYVLKPAELEKVKSYVKLYMLTK